MHETIEHAIDNVNDAFRLLEFSIRVSNYFELDKVDIELFGCDSLIRLERKNVSFNDSYFASKKKRCADCRDSYWRELRRISNCIG